MSRRTMICLGTVVATAIGAAGMQLRGETKEPTRDPTYTMDSKVLVVSRGESVVALDAATLRSLWKASDYNGGAARFSITPDNKSVVTGGIDFRQMRGFISVHADLRVRDLATGKMIYDLRGQPGQILDTAVSPDGRWLITGADAFVGDGTLRNLARWDLTTGKVIATVNAHLVPDESRIELNKNKERYGRPPQPAPKPIASAISCVAVSTDSKTAFSGGGDKLIFAWDCTAPITPLDPEHRDAGLRERFHLAGHRDSISGLVVTPDGESLISLDKSGCGLIWSLKTRELVTEFSVAEIEYYEWAHGLAVSPDGKTFAVADKKVASVRDSTTGKEVWRVPVPFVCPMSVAFSPDGRYLAVSGGGRLRAVGSGDAPAPRAGEVTRPTPIAPSIGPGRRGLLGQVGLVEQPAARRFRHQRGHLVLAPGQECRPHLARRFPDADRAAEAGDELALGVMVRGRP